MKKKPGLFAKLCLLAYLGCIGVLVVEASMDGQASANQSNAVGGTIADFFNDVEGDQTVAVVPESLTITNKISEGFIGETYQLATETLPTNSTYKSVVFTSSNENVATINNEGLVSFISLGETTIEVYNINYPDVKDSFLVTVKNVEATSITSSINNLEKVDDCYTLYIGKEYTINTTFNPQNTTVKSLTYTYNSSYLSISNEGIITPLTYTANKELEVSVNHFELSSTFKIKIDYENVVNLESLSISLPNNSVAVGQTSSLSINVSPSNATFKDYTITSSDTSILKIKGKSVTGVKTGTATIKIQSDTYDSISYSLDVEVTPQPEIQDFTPQNKTIFVGEEVKLTYKKVPSYAKDPSNIEYTSLDTSIATVSNNGVVKGLKVGTTSVKIKMNNIEKTCSIYVKPVEVEGDFDFDLTVLNNYLNYGQEYDFNDIVKVKKWYPSTPSDKGLTFDLKNSSHGELNGDKVKMLSLGEHTLLVTHTASNLTKSITVNCVPYNYLLVDKNNSVITDLDLKVNDKAFFKIYDTQETEPYYQTYEILCSDNKLASIQKVDDGYEINVLDDGDFTVNVKAYIDHELVNTQTINVVSKHVYSTSIAYNITNLTTNELLDVSTNNVKLYLHNTYSLKAVLSNNATSSRVRYSSSNTSVIYINSNGNLYLRKTGYSRITITDTVSELSTYVDINVFNHIALNKNNPFSIDGEKVEKLDHFKYAITNGFSAKLTVNFDEKSTYKVVTYSSSDEKVASIGRDGTITPHKIGTTKITVTCDDGLNEKIEFSIEIEIKRQDYIKDLSAFFYKVRKGLGHFSAFLILGIFSTFTWLLFFRGKKLFFSVPLNFISGYFIAALTEFIQLYVPGRSGNYADVILDFNGFLVSSSILTVILIIHHIRLHIRFKKQDI